MCGLVAALDTKGGAPPPEIIDRMRDTLSHRGPDAAASFFDGPLALGHRRLSILDLSPLGRQPMANEDGSLWLVFNGEIYNYLELREPLLKKGHRFRSQTDSEVVLHLYEEVGDDFLTQLRGMFAFVLWDAPRRRLVAARDRLGKKPLYYAWAGSTLLMASEIKALLAHPAVRRTPSLAAVHEYLTWQYVPAPQTAYEGILALPAAHRMVVQNGLLDVARYWQPRFLPKSQLTEDEALEQLGTLLRESVRLRLRSDVPWGVQLSGGLDSSLVAALAAEATSRLHTFSVGFGDRSYDERPYARQVARHLGTDHHELEARPDLLDLIPHLVRAFDQPFADPAALPSLILAKEMRRHVTVALNGDGGDETFAGYSRYAGAPYWRVFRKVPPALRGDLILEGIARMADRLGLPGAHRLRRWRELGEETLAQHYSRVMSRFSPEWLSRLYTPEMWDQLADAGVKSRVHESVVASQRSGLGSLDALLAADMETYLANDLLVKVDITAMASSLEVRSPMLDHLFVEFAAALPESFKRRGRTGKFLLRKLGGRLLPKDIVTRPKAGFGVPLRAWLSLDREAEVRARVLEGSLARSALFRKEGLLLLVKGHARGEGDYSAMLFSLLVLEAWHQHALGGGSL